MSSELELLRQRITELEAENTKLRQIIEENSKREAESAEHKVRMEEMETDAVLGEVYKKSVSNEIRGRNREKKLLRESAIQVSSSVTKDKKSQSHKKWEAENIVQDVVDFTTTSAPEKNHMTEISM